MSKNNNFEDSIKELELIVKSFESGNLSLEESLEAYEKGIKLSQQCEEFLDNAKQRIDILQEKEKES